MDEQRNARVYHASEDYAYAPLYRLRPHAARALPDLRIFLNVPKAGGTGVDFLFACGAAIAGRRYHRFAVVDFSPPVAIVDGWTGAWKHVKRGAARMPKDTGYVSGHFPFGVHKYLPGRAGYCTVVRDPVGREISSYNFHYQSGFIDGRKSLAAMIDDGEVLDNPQTRMIAGVAAMRGPCDEHTLKRAIHNLKHAFYLVGVNEQANDFVRALASLEGWPSVAYARAQVTRVKLIDRPDPELERRLRDYHRHDRALHAAAAGLWETWKRRNVDDTSLRCDTDPVMVIPPDFRQTHRARFVRRGDPAYARLTGGAG